MGTHVIKVPDIGEGIAEVELVEWHVKPGDAVAEEQTLADVMTDKATVEIPAPVAGKVFAIAGKPGDTIAVGSELIRLEIEGAGNVTSAAVAKEEKPKAAASPQAEQQRAEAPAQAADAKRGSAPSTTVAAKAKSTTTPTAPVTPPPAPTPRAADERPIASPAVRRHAWDMGVELRFIRGTGPSGRIMHE